jgi:membrane protein YqaA with SNARE-associated domain
MIYLNIFFISLVSATLLPMGSEALLLYYIYEKNSLTYLLIFATLGNSLGSIINYYLGSKGFEYLERKKHLNRKMFIRSKWYIKKYGYFALLFSWVPIIGDPITFVAGVARLNIYKFILIVSIAKFSRYAIIAYLAI